jgi:outer membrane biogenesis lipoprotein LolB
MKAATKTTAKKPRTPKLPVKELKAWLKGRKFWSHNDWLALLEDLRKKGYGTLTDTQEGRVSIGNFLEANRSK